MDFTSLAPNLGWTSLFGDAIRDASRHASSERPHRESEGRLPRGRTPSGTQDSSYIRPAPSRPALTAIDGVPVADIVTRIVAGDQQAFGTLYVALRVPLWRLARILVRQDDSADEIVQHVFLTVWLNRAHLDPHNDIRAYFNTAIRNAARQRHRHDRVVTTVESAVTSDALPLPAIGQPAERPDMHAELREFYAAYQDALTALSERERIALQLRLEEELSFEEIGDVLGLSNVGARKVVLRAEAKARQLLAGFRP